MDEVERINACSFVNTIPTYHTPTPMHPMLTNISSEEGVVSDNKNEENRQNHRLTSSSSPSPFLSLPSSLPSSSSSSPTSVAHCLLTVSGKTTDCDSMDSFRPITASPTSHHNAINGTSHRDSPKPLKKRPMAQSTMGGTQVDTDDNNTSSSKEIQKIASSTDIPGKKRSHQFMSMTTDDVQGEPGYFSMTLVR